MPYLSGVRTGILLTILAVYLIDHAGSQPGTQDIVNWSVVSQKLGAAQEEVRQEVHEATAPKEAAIPEPAPHATSESATPAAPSPTPQTP
jgi:hypothetical protein